MLVSARARPGRSQTRDPALVPDAAQYAPRRSQARFPEKLKDIVTSSPVFFCRRYLSFDCPGSRSSMEMLSTQIRYGMREAPSALRLRQNSFHSLFGDDREDVPPAWHPALPSRWMLWHPPESVPRAHISWMRNTSKKAFPPGVPSACALYNKGYNKEMRDGISFCRISP